MTYTLFLILHIVSGFTALASGLLAILSKKGSGLHRGVGKTFFFSMLGVCFTAVYISITKSNSFLLVIGIFSFYLNYFGYRALKDKSLSPKLLDWLVLGMTAATAAFMLVSANPVLVVFGLICFYAIFKNVQISVRVLQKKALPELMWLRRHIGMMVGAFIATTTAFLVVNTGEIKGDKLPVWLPWLLPTFLLVPLIYYYMRKYAPIKKPA